MVLRVSTVAHFSYFELSSIYKVIGKLTRIKEW